MKKFVFFLLVVVIAVGAALAKWGFQPVPPRKLAGSIALWQQTIAREIPVGTERKDILAWARKNDIALYKMGYAGLYGVVDTLKSEGINFPCSIFHIVVEIQMDADKKSKTQKIRSTDGCGGGI